MKAKTFDAKSEMTATTWSIAVTFILIVVLIGINL